MRLIALPALATATLALTVAGCSNPVDDLGERLAEEGIEQIIEDGTDGDVDVDLGLDGGASLPDNWPSEIPEPIGEILAAIAEADSGTVTFSPPSSDDVLAYLQELVDAGWTLTDRASVGGEFASLDNGNWLVSLAWFADEVDTSATLYYEPSESGVAPSADPDVEIDLGTEGGTELPSNWPASAPVPDGDIIYAATDGGTGLVTFTSPGGDYVDSFIGDLESAGWEITAQAESATGNYAELENGEQRIAMSWFDDDPTVTVTYESLS